MQRPDHSFYLHPPYQVFQPFLCRNDVAITFQFSVSCVSLPSFPQLESIIQLHNSMINIDLLPISQCRGVEVLVYKSQNRNKAAGYHVRLLSSFPVCSSTFRDPTAWLTAVQFD